MGHPQENPETEHPRGLTPNWDALKTRFDKDAVDELRKRYETAGSFHTTAAELAEDLRIDAARTTPLLDELTDEGVLARHAYAMCDECGRSRGVTAEGTCPDGHPIAPDAERTIRYELEREPPREVPWVLVLHGMNTPGAWQEELSWLIGRTYRRMVPVAIYKYGIVRPGVLFRWRQNMLVRDLADKIVTLTGEAVGAGYGGRPDVIAHSFGTWLIAHALATDPRIRIGRLILLGCIVRPDFDWQTPIRDHRVDRVLNHGASLDRWVRMSELAIPDSGSGGLRGFHEPVLNVMSEGLTHSDYFTQPRMATLFRNVWQPFLKWQEVPDLPGETRNKPWKPLPEPVRAITRSIAVAIAVLLCASGAWLLFLGVERAWNLIREIWRAATESTGGSARPSRARSAPRPSC